MCLGPFPHSPFRALIQTFLYVKSVLLLTFKGIEIKVLLSDYCIWKEFDPASIYMDFRASPRKKNKDKQDCAAVLIRNKRSAHMHSPGKNDGIGLVRYFSNSKLPPQNRNNPQETERWIRGKMATLRRESGYCNNEWSFLTAETKQFFFIMGFFKKKFVLGGYMCGVY